MGDEKLFEMLQQIEENIKVEEVQVIEILRTRILQAEKERLDGVETITISEARKRLHERILDNNE